MNMNKNNNTLCVLLGLGVAMIFVGVSIAYSFTEAMSIIGCTISTFGGIIITATSQELF